jgi:hypothetical protein
MIGNRSALHLAFRSLEAVRKLLKEILDNTLVVVAPTQDVVERREAVGLAGLFLMVELLGLEFVIADHAPVIAGRIHREAWCQSSIDANNH